MPRVTATSRFCQYRADVTPKRSYMRVVMLSLTGILAVAAIASWLLTLPSDEYILLPDDPHPADAVISVGGAKPVQSGDGSGIYYLDVLVHQASVPESWLSGFEDGATVLPAAAVVPPGGSADRPRPRRPPHVRRLAHRRARRGAARARAQDVKVERTGVTFDGVDRPAPAYRAGLRPGMVITAIDGVPVPRGRGSRDADGRAQAGLRDRASASSTARASSSCKTTLTSDPGDAKRAIIGILGVHAAPPRAQLPVKVKISPQGLGRGPSAGLAFTLEIYDALSGHSSRRAARSRSRARSTSTARSARSAASARR